MDEQALVNGVEIDTSNKIIISTKLEWQNLKSKTPYTFFCKNCKKEVNISGKRIGLVHIQTRFLCKKCGTIETTKQRYGVNSVLQTDIVRNKKPKITTQDFIEKAKLKHGDKYDYSLVDYKGSDVKVKIICKNKYHSGYIFEQTPHTHLCCNGCPKCGGNVPMSNSEFEIRAREIHGNKYDYSKVNFKNMNTKVTITCPNHGDFSQVARCHIDPNFRYGCPHCNMSHGEKEIDNFLKNNNIIFERQKTFDLCTDKTLLPFDFYIPSRNLLIEYNGEQHYIKGSFKHHDLRLQRHHDWLKRRFARNNNFNFLVIPYWDFVNIRSILEKELDINEKRN